MVSITKHLCYNLANLDRYVNGLFLHNIKIILRIAMDKELISQMGQQLLSGKLSLEQFQEVFITVCNNNQLKEQEERSGRLTSGVAHIDLERAHRCGYPEVIYAEGKTPEAIIDIFRLQTAHEIDCFATRMSEEKAAQVIKEFPQGIYNSVARTFRIPSKKTIADPKSFRGKVAIISAGTSDRPVAEEAKETALWMGAEVLLIQDVGVAGPERLRSRYPEFQDADAIVVVAGMEGALPSVVGGYVSAPVIAVPTSVGYGAAFGGLAALLGMLNSCASNVVVVNIDAGFKGGYVAGLIAGQRSVKK